MNQPPQYIGFVLEKHDQKSAAPEQNQGGETEGQQLEEEQDSQTKWLLRR
jgi:hypothetical protein